MAFDFLKTLFYKASGIGSKRKASDLDCEADENGILSKRRRELAGISRIESLSVTNGDSNLGRKKLNVLQHLATPNNAVVSRNGITSVPYKQTRKLFSENGSGISNQHQKLEKNELGRNFISPDAQRLFGKEPVRRASLFSLSSSSPRSFANSSRITDGNKFNRPWHYFKMTPIKTCQMNGTLEKSSKEIDDNSKLNSSCSVTKITKNSLKDELSAKKVLDQNFISQITKKYDERYEQKNRQAEELKRIAHGLSRHNQIQRQAAYENYLSRSMRLCEAVLDETEVEEVELPELNDDMMKQVRVALSNRGSADEVLAEGFGMTVRRRDMQTLAGLNWLNDEVINYYMNLLISRGENDKYPNVHAMNTFFFPKLVSSGYSTLKRWTRKIDIFSKDLVIVPIHLGVHWCMSIIDFREKSIRYYDSMGTPNTRCLEALKQYLLDESIDKKKQRFDLSGWTYESMRNIPQQMNTSDCGVFSCTFAEFISANRDLNFSQDDMPYFRSKMVYEILTGKLL